MGGRGKKGGQVEVRDRGKQRNCVTVRGLLEKYVQKSYLKSESERTRVRGRELKNREGSKGHFRGSGVKETKDRELIQSGSSKKLTKLV